MNFYLGIVLFLIIAEISLYILVRYCRKSFPWLITEQDEAPSFDNNALNKFIDYSFDPDLGWTRRPNTNGVERGRKGEIKFHIDSTGSRSNSLSDLAPYIAAFGDSYTFCRQVEDDETWEAELAKEKNIGVLNYGVGNYGVDQALVRYEQTSLPDSVKIVVMGFVPETICRIQSYWKHYLEFGNTFAFKPRFIIGADGELSQLPNLVRNLEHFEQLDSLLIAIRKHDVFYKKKFRKVQFRFPYSLSLLRNPVRHVKLISVICFRGLLRRLHISSEWAENLPFALIMRENIRQAHALYSDKDSTDLLAAILNRFKQQALANGHTPLVLVMPQLFDLKLIQGKNIPYKDFYQKLKSQITVIDVTDQFLGERFEDLYVNDQYGGHLSAFGNALVSSEISKWLSAETEILN